jgi:hypothetical protein
LFLLGFVALIFRIHHSRFAAVFTQKLLTACAVFAVLDNMRTITFWTMKCYFVFNHAAFIPSFRKNHYRMVIYLKVVKNLSNHEVAETLSKSIGAVKVIYNRGLRTLLHLLFSGHQFMEA